MNPLTLDDIAKMANVVGRTVSRVINNEPGVGAKKRAEIQQLILETGFKPNTAARAIASSKSYIITIVSNWFGATYYTADIQVGAMRACVAAGYHLMTEVLTPGPEIDLDLIRRRFTSPRPDAVILIPPICDDLNLLDSLDAAGLVYVRLSPSINKERGLIVEMDDEQATFEMTKSLIGQGHKAIGFFEAIHGFAAQQIRKAGFQRAMDEAGLLVEEVWVPIRPRFEPYIADLEAYMLQVHRPTAVVCGSDTIALGAIGTAGKLGLRVPHDISIVGFDDSPGSDVFWPPLTTVHQPVADMASAAVEMAIAELSRQSQPSARARVFDYRIIKRQSDGPVPPPA